ncbi:hypothetical protein N7474_003128 [Penicillium riverlandense]|uniref:uncharacterized protein n=1 Tax=Penicillium riverlandense TaxID=1903569 RepID=UPI0025495C6B|nr:uncharacterized protein N7474_003128 [Penicillium riverlandense]KAJ5825990.1 hypothetical protein N7474_003128 [Penicillium riverlandense]
MPVRNSPVPNLDLSSSKSASSNAKVSSPLTPGDQSSDGPSPRTPRSPKSSSSSPFLKGATIRPVTQDSSSKPNSPSLPNSADPAAESTDPPPTPGFTAIPQHFPTATKHGRDASRSFFGNLKAPKSSHRAHRSDSSENSTTEPPKSRGSSRDRKTHMSPKSYESTPDLPGAIAGAADNEKGTFGERGIQSDYRKAGTDTESAGPKKSKPRFASLLTRSRSIRVDESSANKAAGRRPSTGLAKLEELRTQSNMPTAPQSALPRLDHRPVQDTLRTPTIESSGATLRKERSYGGSMVTSGSLSQVSGASAALFNNLKQSSTGAAGRLGKAGKGFFGKMTRSGSTNERELLTDDTYVCSVINLPLIEQARKTRIAKKLEDCRDKTEFWMPALPYRCIDYLNFKGCEEEGLYRVPGSGREVKHWQRRFDSELDIDLFDVPDLYDINIIGSMFKAWLRELPDELFPKATQDMIAEKCEGATTAPQLLKDELSKLPPYNYYLLFAITCHLNLLHSYVDQNKMDYRNLCICFQPCMKIDAFCFNFLVCDWKNCWQGCWTEKDFIQIEKEMDEKERQAAEEKIAASAATEKAQGSAQNSTADEHAVSSSSSSQHTVEEPSSRPNTSRSRKQRPKDIDTSHGRNPSQLPELGPPLSPIKI